MRCLQMINDDYRTKLLTRISKSITTGKQVINRRKLTKAVLIKQLKKEPYIYYSILTCIVVIIIIIYSHIHIWPSNPKLDKACSILMRLLFISKYFLKYNSCI